MSSPCSLVSDAEEDDDDVGKELWRQILASPIQRGWTDPAGRAPVSFEVIQTAARTVAARPRDVVGWLDQEYKRLYTELHPGQRSSHRAAFISFAGTSPRDRLVYRCPHNHFV